MGLIMNWFAYPFGWVMWFLYSFIQNYGLVILVFTLITKILLIPVSVKQHKSTIERTRLQPKLEELKVKYGKNPQKYSEEMMALYKKEGIDSAGCGTYLIQMPILFGMIGVVYAPLKYILQLSDDVILKASQIASKVIGSDILSKINARGDQYIIINTLKAQPEKFKELGQDIIDKIFNLRFDFLGMDLSKSPSLPHSLSDFNMLLLIPVLAFVTSLLVSIQSMKNNEKSAVDDASKQAAQSMKMMMFLMPLMSTWLSFKFPSGIGLYWIFSNVFTSLQTWILYKKYNPVEVITKAREEMAALKEKERQDRIEARKRLSDRDSLEKDTIYEGMSQKEINKIKLANARKRDAEKYGDYVE